MNNEQMSGSPVDPAVMQHSPGPWKFEDTPGQAWTLSDANGISLMGDEQYYPWAPSEKADWHLIAAAPEMLAALQGLLAAVQGGVCEGSGPAQDAARSAINKALGRL